MATLILFNIDFSVKSFFKEWLLKIMKTKYFKNMESAELHCHKTKLHAHGVSLKDRLRVYLMRIDYFTLLAVCTLFSQDCITFKLWNSTCYLHLPLEVHLFLSILTSTCVATLKCIKNCYQKRWISKKENVTQGKYVMFIKKSILLVYLCFCIWQACYTLQSIILFPPYLVTF